MAPLESLYNKSAWDSLTQGYSSGTLLRLSKAERKCSKGSSSPIPESCYRTGEQSLLEPHASEPPSTTTEDPIKRESSRLSISQLPHSCCRSPHSISPFFSIPTYQPPMSQTCLHSTSLTSVWLPLTAELVPNVLDPFWDAGFFLLKHMAQKPSKIGLTCLVFQKSR